MRNWRKAIVQRNATIQEAMIAIEASAIQAAIILDEMECLLGLATDGDIRRGFLKGNTMQDSITLVMNKNPTVIFENDDREQARLMMKKMEIHHVPIVSSDNKLLVDFIYIDNINLISHEHLVILMAGGLGSRLRPLTDEYPKPLLKIAGKPISELLLEEFIRHGFRNFCFSVNYKAEMIQEYFLNGAKWSINIEYIIESKKLGTAGALSLLKKRPSKPIIVANADIMTRLDFSQALNFHVHSKAGITVCVRNYQHTIPYGVIRMEDDRLVRIEEKPVQDFHVSAGIYILDPEIIARIPHDIYCDMPDLITSVSESGIKIAVFPISEYWLDIANTKDLEKAHHDYETVF